MPRLVAGAGHQRVVPALDVGEIRQLDLVARMAPGPAQDGKIGDRQSPATNSWPSSRLLSTP